jgi:lambda repressor-like predicted transcriptional regulator
MPRSQRTHPDQIYSEAKLLVTQGYSIRKAAIELGLPYTTVQNHINGKYKGYITKFWEECLLKPVDDKF